VREAELRLTAGEVDGLVNALGVIPQNPLFDTASWSAELTYATWAKVISGQNLFFAEGFAPCKGKDVGDGCTTKNYTGLSLAFSPTADAFLVSRSADGRGWDMPVTAWESDHDIDFAVGHIRYSPEMCALLGVGGYMMICHGRSDEGAITIEQLRRSLRPVRVNVSGVAAQIGEEEAAGGPSGCHQRVMVSPPFPD
jgi:hypothetical protein